MAELFFEAVFGIFRSPREVNAALAKLQAAGVNRNLVKLLPPRNLGPKDFHQKQRTSIRGGMITGAVAGGIIFFLISLFITIDVIRVPYLHNITKPESQTLFVLIGALAGTILGGAAGALIGIGTPEPAPHRYASYLIAGGTLLSVRILSSDNLKTIHQILEGTSAQDISTLNEMEGWRSVHEELHVRAPKPQTDVTLRKNEYVKT
jgi:hypothetical protein